MKTELKLRGHTENCSTIHSVVHLFCSFGLVWGLTGNPGVPLQHMA